MDEVRLLLFSSLVGRDSTVVITWANGGECVVCKVCTTSIPYGAGFSFTRQVG